ncbi:MAG: hypothetical protein U5L98_08010 [Halomonas sp.]|nr:hypothetical protein [Halomonas sp.]
MSQIGYIIAAFAAASHLVDDGTLPLGAPLRVQGYPLPCDRRGDSANGHEHLSQARRPHQEDAADLRDGAHLHHLRVGVPPLAGFGGKWLLYTALLEEGLNLQAALAFFASTIAFLYLFKLIHAVFLGQPKDELRGVREAPVWLLIPQLALVGGIMAMSMYPTIILGPIAAAVSPYIASTVAFEGYTVVSALGYWNGNTVMYVTMGVFALPLVWLLVAMKKPQRVEQFNIVFAAERPERPETTHYAHNFFTPYYRALDSSRARALSDSGTAYRKRYHRWGARSDGSTPATARPTPCTSCSSLPFSISLQEACR